MNFEAFYSIQNKIKINKLGGGGGGGGGVESRLYNYVNTKLSLLLTVKKKKFKKNCCCNIGQKMTKIVLHRIMSKINKQSDWNLNLEGFVCLCTHCVLVVLISA